jgi:hypothetical protein
MQTVAKCPCDLFNVYMVSFCQSDNVTTVKQNFYFHKFDPVGSAPEIGGKYQ